MTWKDYEQIADKFHKVRFLIGEGTMSDARMALNCIETELLNVMKSDNAQFDVDRFMKESHPHDYIKKMGNSCLAERKDENGLPFLRQPGRK